MNSTSEEEPGSLGRRGGVGELESPCYTQGLGAQGGPVAQTPPFGKEHWGGSQQESPAPP